MLIIVSLSSEFSFDNLLIFYYSISSFIHVVYADDLTVLSDVCGSVKKCSFIYLRNIKSFVRLLLLGFGERGV